MLHHKTLSRRSMLAAAAAFALPAWAAPAGKAGAALQLVEVWKSPTCGCCGDWISYMQANGFRTKVNEVDSATPMRRRLGLPDKYGSCHTAVVGGYVLEGHVPAREIKRLLQEMPKGVLGIEVPGMPLGSPGMDGPVYEGRKTPHDVLLVMRDGSASVYQSYR